MYLKDYLINVCPLGLKCICNIPQAPIVLDVYYKSTFKTLLSILLN